MVEKYFGGEIPGGKNELNFDIEKIKRLMDDYELTQALNEIWKFVNEINKYINEKKPWENDNKECTLYTVLDSLRIVGVLLYPFIPWTIEKLNKQIGLKLGDHQDLKKNLLQMGKILKRVLR